MNFCWRTLSEIAIYKSQCALKKNQTVGINHLKLKIVYIKTYVEGAKYEKISTLMKWKKKMFQKTAAKHFLAFAESDIDLFVLDSVDIVFVRG